MEPTPLLIEVQELAQVTGVPGSWLRREAEAGRLPALRAGRRLLFHVPTVERYLLETAARSIARPEGEPVTAGSGAAAQ